MSLRRIDTDPRRWKGFQQPEVIDRKSSNAVTPGKPEIA